MNKWADKLANAIFPSDEEWQEIFRKRMILVPDIVFDYLSEAGTEVNARIKINDETKIVEKGALWYEESLPAETILVGMANCDKIFGTNNITTQIILDTFCTEPILCQIGGNATTGKGQVNIHFEKVN